eukprot:GDKI01027304.1.p1 GENE.GDKI01027304.1~~GDKI01027304.1.p1  ORF type:complete len:427 (+),score=33.10 GDKI01027304.1:100-1380(+)
MHLFLQPFRRHISTIRPVQRFKPGPGSNRSPSYSLYLPERRLFTQSNSNTIESQPEHLATSHRGEMLIRDAIRQHPLLDAEKVWGFSIADLVVWRKGDTENKLGVQVKTTERLDGGNHRYRFSQVHGYSGMPVVCVCVQDKKCWLFDGTELSNQKTDTLRIYPGRESGVAIVPHTEVSFNHTAPNYIGNVLLSSINGKTWRLGSDSYWEEQQNAANHRTERETAIRIKPFLYNCGITLEKPDNEWQKVDNTWITRDGFRFGVQNKTAGWHSCQSYKSHINTKISAGMKDGKQTWQPYHFNHFDILCIAGPATLPLHPNLEQIREQLGVSHLLHVIDNHTLLRNGIMHNSFAGTWNKTGRIHVYFLYPCVRDFLKNNVRLTNRTMKTIDELAWMDEFLLDMREVERSAVALNRLLRKCAKIRDRGAG